MRAFLTLLIIGFTGVFFYSYAAENKNTSGINKKDSVAVKEYVGTVISKNNVITLLSGEEEYVLHGKNLEGLVGKKAKLIGKNIKVGETQTILVSTIIDIAKIDGTKAVKPKVNKSKVKKPLAKKSVIKNKN
jgi:hypothetical protein